MAKVLVTDTNLTNIANAIRGKNGATTSYKVDEMASAIESISTSGGSGGATPHNITCGFDPGDGTIQYPPQGYTGQELIFTLKDSPYSNPLVLYGEDGLIEPTILDSYSYSPGSAILAHFMVYSFIMPDADVDILI